MRERAGHGIAQKEAWLNVATVNLAKKTEYRRRQQTSLVDWSSKVPACLVNISYIGPTTNSSEPAVSNSPQILLYEHHQYSTSCDYTVDGSKDWNWNARPKHQLPRKARS
jgi:hypothetical protein